MKLRDIMTGPVVWIHQEETVEVAARMLERNHIGALPVCDGKDRLCGMLTDRDIVTRCLASGKSPQTTCVREVMTGKVYVGRPDMDIRIAASLMGKEQIRRLPVMGEGKLCGMVSIGDLAEKGAEKEAVNAAINSICSGLSAREG